MTAHIVATVDEIPPGGRKLIQVDGREIGVFNIGGHFYAIRNRCPHQAGPLCRGRLASALRSSGPGDYSVEDAGATLRCPWHQWEFDIRTGQSWFDPARVRARAYKTRVEQGAALTTSDEGKNSNIPQEDSLPADKTRTGKARPARTPGPYTAETYPIVVDRHYVVVELSRQRQET